jgi:hypothetical protein
MAALDPAIQAAQRLVAHFCLAHPPCGLADATLPQGQAGG